MAATNPPSPLPAPPSGSGTDEDAVSWAATVASGGEGPYAPPRFHRNLATIEMPPHVPTPAAPGCVWLPIEVFSRRGLRDRQMRRIAIAVWRASVWNTWKSHYRLYCAGACLALLLASIFTADVVSSRPYKMTTVQVANMLLEVILFFTPGVVLGVVTLAASRAIRYATPAKVIASVVIILGIFIPFASTINLIRELLR